MTFWCRRCTEHSRSKRCTTWPWASAKICTSTWRGRSTSRSTYSVPSPNAATASRRARLNRVGDLLGAPDDAHAFAAAAGRRLDERRQPDAVHGAPQPLVGLIVGRLARHDRDAGRLHQPPRFDLRSHARDHGGGRPDEDEAGLSQAAANAAFSERKP